MPVIPRMGAPVSLPTNRVTRGTRGVQRTTTGDDGRQSGPFVPGEVLLVKQSHPMGRKPVEHRREIPSDMRLPLTSHRTFGDGPARDHELDPAHRPAMTGRPSFRRLCVLDPADGDLERIRTSESNPVIHHRCSTPIRCCVCRRFGNVSSGVGSPVPIPRGSPVPLSVHRPKGSDIRATFHHCSIRPRMRRLVRLRSGDHPRFRGWLQTTRGPSSAAMDGPARRRKSPGCQPGESTSGRAFRTRRPVASVCA